MAHLLLSVRYNRSCNIKIMCKYTTKSVFPDSLDWCVGVGVCTSVCLCVLQGRRESRGVRRREKQAERRVVKQYFRKMPFVCPCGTWINTVGYGQILIFIREDSVDHKPTTSSQSQGKSTGILALIWDHSSRAVGRIPEGQWLE